MKKNKFRKTRYCIHYHHCDRDEDCFNGEECPVYEFNPNCASIERDAARDFIDIMDDIWEGEEDKDELRAKNKYKTDDCQ